MVSAQRNSFSDVPHMVTFLMGCVHRYFAIFQTTKVGDIQLMENDGIGPDLDEDHSDGFGKCTRLNM